MTLRTRLFMTSGLVAVPLVVGSFLLDERLRLNAMEDALRSAVANELAFGLEDRCESGVGPPPDRRFLPPRGPRGRGGPPGGGPGPGGYMLYTYAATGRRRPSTPRRCLPRRLHLLDRRWAVACNCDSRSAAAATARSAWPACCPGQGSSATSSWRSALVVVVGARRRLGGRRVRHLEDAAPGRAGAAVCGLQLCAAGADRARRRGGGAGAGLQRRRRDGPGPVDRDPGARRDASAVRRQHHARCGDPDVGAAGPPVESRRRARRWRRTWRGRTIASARRRQGNALHGVAPQESRGCHQARRHQRAAQRGACRSLRRSWSVSSDDIVPLPAPRVSSSTTPCPARRWWCRPMRRCSSRRSAISSTTPSATTPPGGHVAVVLDRVADDGFVLSVTDDGVGVGDEELAQLTKRWYRGSDARTRRPDGKGLGLAIASEACERLGLTLTLSRPGAGGLSVAIATAGDKAAS